MARRALESARARPSLGGGKMSELRQRLLFVLGAILIFRIGSFIPVPGIDPVALEALFEQQRGTILDMFNMFSGGALSRFSIFAIGIMPYISAAIIMQLLSVVHPKLEQLKKEGEQGRRKITQYTRYGTVLLATFQALGVAIALESQSAGGAPVVIAAGLGFRITTVVTLVTGTIFLMWLGEQVSERGIGNGISIIIFAGIVAGLPSAVGGTLELARIGELHVLLVLLLLVLALAVTGFVVFVERGQRRITVNYAKRQIGRRMYSGQTSHLPLKLNMAGVIPPIFASSIILFPATLGGWFGSSEELAWLGDISTTLSPGQPPVRPLLRGRHRVLLLLLHRPRIQSARHGRQPQAVGGVHPGGAPRRADRAAHRRGDDPAHGRGGRLHHRGLPAPGVPDRPVGRPVLLRGHLAAHHRGGGDGLHGPGPGPHDVAPARGAAPQGEPEGATDAPGWCGRRCGSWPGRPEVGTGRRRAADKRAGNRPGRERR